MGEIEAVAGGRGQRLLAGRNELGLKELSSAGGGEDLDARSVLPRQMLNDVLFGSRVHGVVADLEKVHRRPQLSAGDLAEEGALVAGHSHEARLAAVPEPMHAVDKLLNRKFALILFEEVQYVRFTLS